MYSHHPITFQVTFYPRGRGGGGRGREGGGDEENIRV